MKDGKRVAPEDFYVRSVPQDVEEFIADNAVEGDGYHAAPHYIIVDDLRAWMAGHARVPVDILGISEFALRRLQYDMPKSGTDYELITRALNAMLTASKEGASCNYPQCKCPIDKNRHCLKGLPNA
jgi:hypothetical protein